MKGIILFLILIFASSNVQAASSKWKKHYSIVMSDIRSVEALKTKDLALRVRLFELYGEKLTLLLDKESEYRIEYLEKGSSKRLNNIIRLQKTTLAKLDKLARRIERQTKNKKVLTKINYFRALNYYLTKNYKKFYYYIKKAERTNTDPKYRQLIDTKLADYHFNEKQYRQAEKYYSRLIKNKRDPWITKHYYNLAWSQLKLDKFNRAINSLRVAHKYERRSKNFKIGEQLKDALLLFYAFSKRTKEGLNYFKKYDMDSFDELLKYLHYVFENGEKKHSELVIKRILQKKLTPEQEFKLLSKRVLVYRTNKQFRYMQKVLGQFKAKIKKLDKRRVKKETVAELVTAIKSYSGYLQELVKSKRLISKKYKKSYVRYIAYNFSVLRVVDPANALAYAYYEGETYFSLENYSRASFTYALGLKKFQKKGKRSNPYLVKTFDSLFKSLERQKKVSPQILTYTYKTYLKYFPKGKKSALVYQRLANFYKGRNENKKMMNVLVAYNKNMPSHLQIQKDLYKQLLNKNIDAKNLDGLVNMQKIVDSGFLGFKKSESAALGKIISQIYLSRFDVLAKKGKVKEAIEGFNALFLDEKTRYSLRADALRKKMFYENKAKEYTGLTESVITSLAFYNPSLKKKYAEETLYYLQNVCLADMHDLCLPLFENISKDKQIRIPKQMVSLYWRMKAIYSEDYDKIYAKLPTVEDRNYLFKILLNEDSSFSSNLYGRYYNEKEKKQIVDAELDKRGLRYFYTTLDIGKTINLLKKVSVARVKSEQIRKLDALDSLLDQIKIQLPKPPKGDVITEDAFMKFGQAVDATAAAIFQKIDTIIKGADPNYLPVVLSQIITKFETEVNKFKKFIPVSNNQELETAMTEAVTNFQKIFDQRLISYRSLYYNSIEKTAKGSGAKIYNRDIITQPLGIGLGKVEVWKE